MYYVFLSALLCFNSGNHPGKVTKNILEQVNATKDYGELLTFQVGNDTMVCADLTGDKKDECVVFVQHAISHKVGILVWEPRSANYVLFGAGNLYDADLLLDNLCWISRFEIVPPGIYASGDSHRAPLETAFDAMRISGQFMGNALIYFDGNTFSYFYQVSPVKGIGE